MKKTASAIQVKRIYEPAAKDDGYRVLVDRLWPRGVQKAKAQVDAWLKEISPSAALRKQFHSHPDLWDAFEKAYTKELLDSHATDIFRDLLAEHGHICLLYAAKDTEHNNAVALRNFLIKKL